MRGIRARIRDWRYVRSGQAAEDEAFFERVEREEGERCAEEEAEERRHDTAIQRDATIKFNATARPEVWAALDECLIANDVGTPERMQEAHEELTSVWPAAYAEEAARYDQEHSDRDAEGDDWTTWIRDPGRRAAVRDCTGQPHTCNPDPEAGA